MPIGFSLLENLRIVEGAAPQVGAAAAVTSDIISTKGLQKLWILVHYNQADANAITFTPMQCTDVAGGTNKVLANVVPIWSDLDCAASDTFVERTAAANYSAGAGAAHKIVVFEIDPSTLDVAGGYDCVYITSGAIAAAQYVSYLFIGLPRVGGPVSQAPSLIVD